MAASAKKKIKTFHATMLVTRAEEWCVDAASADEAKALLAAGQGHRCHLGDAVHIELDQLFDDK
ncbi:MAG: hypothetical protein ACM35E_01065 [Deltaproteobacteria bacterium]|jgi:hypothetical protein